MKSLLILLLFGFVLNEARTMRRVRREIDVLGEMNKVAKNYPKQLWEDFWNSLKDLFDDAPKKIEETFEKPTGMNETLKKLDDNFGDNFDDVVDKLKKAQQETQKLTETLRKTTLADFVTMIKTELQGYIGDIDPQDGQQTLDSLGNRFEKFLNTISGKDT